MTHRQFTVWQAWLLWEWDRPSRTDEYLMQIASILHDIPYRVWGKSPPGSKVSEFRLVHSPQEKGRERGPRDVKEATAWAQTKWFASLGMIGQGK